MSAEEPDDEEDRRRQQEQEAARQAEQDAMVSRLQEAIQQWEQNGNQINEITSLEENQLSSMSTNTIAQLSFLSGVGLAKEGYNILNSEYMRQARYNNSLLKPGFNKEIIISLKVPKGMRLLGKYGGSIFNVFEYYNIEGQYNRGEISKEWMTIEHNSNAVGALPVVGTAWTLGWEAGRSITSIPAYKTYIKKPLQNAFGIKTGN